MHAGPSGADLAAVVADHAFFQYERTLQREYNPELVIHLPAPQSLPAADSTKAVVRPRRLPTLQQALQSNCQRNLVSLAALEPQWHFHVHGPQSHGYADSGHAPSPCSIIKKSVCRNCHCLLDGSRSLLQTCSYPR